MQKERLILITNPGSSSRKYALYKGLKRICSLHFEFEENNVICTIKQTDGTKKKIETGLTELSETVSSIERILEDEGYLNESERLDAVLARAAAPGEYFAHDHFIDEDCLTKLEGARKKAPLHVPVVADEVKYLMDEFKEIPLILISDSGFHTSRPNLTKAYAIDQNLAETHDIKRWGYHGLSVSSIVNYMQKNAILPQKLIVCHIGSGASVTAVLDGKSYDTTMGYTPLEGVMMATRAGSIDPAAALAIKHALNFTSDEELEKYLNKKCGLRGVSGVSDDLRDVIKLKNAGDKLGTFAYELYIYRLQSAIGQMAAALDGADAIVFTATIGERSNEIRKMVTKKLDYLGFSLDEEKNEQEIPERHVNLAAENSKPVYAIRTDEFGEMIRRANLLLEQAE